MLLDEGIKLGRGEKKMVVEVDKMREGDVEGRMMVG